MGVKATFHLAKKNDLRWNTCNIVVAENSEYKLRYLKTLKCSGKRALTTFASASRSNYVTRDARFQCQVNDR